MSERFDPYQTWLGVPRSAQPSYYQLLGLQNFESEPPVIAEAAEQAIAKVAAHRSGPHKDTAERVLTKLKSAKDVLLSAEKRQAYDQQLRTHLGPAMPPPPAAPVSAVDSPTMMLPPGALPPLSAGGYPPTAPAGYPPGYGAPGYGAAPGYAGQAPQGFAGQAPQGFAGAPSPYAQAPGYPPQAPGYPPQGPGYPPMGGMPPQAGFAPQAGYAPQQAYAPSAEPFAQNPAPQAPGLPGSFIPFGGLSHSLGDVPTAAAPAAPPYAAPPAMAPMTPPLSAPAMGQVPGMGMGSPMGAPAGAPAGSVDPGFAPRQSTPAIRRGTQRRQQNSSIMLGLAVLGGAVALLVVAMIAANKNDDTQARNDTVPTVVTPTQPSPTAPSSPGLGISYLTQPEPMRVDPTFNDGSSGQPNAAAGSNVPSSVNVGTEMTPGMPNQQAANNVAANNIIGKLIPDGYKPSPATPTSTGMLPDAMPAAATPSGTASMPAPPAPSGTAPAPASAPGPAPKPTPISIAGTSTGAPAMEASLPADAARARAVQTMAKSVKASLKARDYAKAEDVALQSLVLADAPDVVAMTFEQHRAVELVRSLWSGARDGVKSLKPDEEIIFNGKAAKVVRHDETTLVVSQDNKEVTLLIAKLVPGLAVQMAERALPADDATTKLAAGVFLSVDAVGDKEKGRALITEAGAAGAEVEKLIAWLDMPE